ncbi:WD40-repeat-containing domain protein [Rhizoctonia solani]|nr:WD40-repeat-containing domain protein [Rhizoctonia solani]
MRTQILPLSLTKRFRGRTSKSSGPTKPLQPVQPLSPRPGGADDPPPHSNKYTQGWSHLNNLAALLVSASGALVPLKDVVNGLVECIEFYEREANGRHEYAALQNELEVLFKDLKAHLVCSSPTMTPCIEGLYKSIKEELDCIPGKQKRMVLRPFEAGDSNTILAVYRRIQGHLQRLSLNANLSMWRVMEQHITDVQSDRISTYLNRLSPSLSAHYNSTQALGLKRGPCTPGTRTDALTRVTDWIQDSAPGGVYWLDGMAGTGKTTIAYSLCADLDAKCKLAASFFCSRLLPECRDANLILPSIAYQLARFSLPFRFALSKVLERDPDVHTRLPQIQFDALIQKPLLEIQATLPSDLVVVVDGLDECKDEEHTGHVLGVLLTGLTNLPIKLIVSSRPEPEIRSWMNGRANAKLALHELDKSVVQADIEAYLRIALRPMNLSEPKIAALVQRAGILFIYASTVVRYISYRNFCRNPHARLDAVLNTSSSLETIPNTEIDQLYDTILEAALDDQKINEVERDDMKKVLNTVICAQEPLTISALSELLQLHNRDCVCAALDPLWSVLHVMGTSELVTPLHISFPEYMLDLTRSRRHHCDLGKHSETLARLCFECIRRTDPQFNICQLESSCIYDDQVENLDLRTQKSMSTELFYACLYWAYHLYNAKGANALKNQLEDFLSNRLLLWLEVLNLKKTMRFVGRSINSAEIWCEHHGCSRDLIELAHDCWRFASTFALNPISNSTPHIYTSMLPFWSQSSPVGKHYLKRARGMVEVRGPAMNRHHLAPLATWCFKGLKSACSSPDGASIALALGSQLFIVDAFSGHVAVSPFIGHTHEISAVSFSPDGAYIVSGSRDFSLRMWHAQNGEVMFGPLHGHTDEITSVKYSPNGRRVVSGSRDKTVRVWDALSGEALLALGGHTGPVLSVAFISNGTCIASGSTDKTIRTWDARSGEVLLESLNEHADSVTCIVPSPKGELVSGSGDKTICVWNAQTGELVLGPLKGHTSSVTCIVFSPDGTRIVSGSYDCCIRVWDAQTGEMIFGQLQGHTSAVSWIGFSPKGTRMMSSGAWDNTVCVWDAQTQTARLQPQGEVTYPITSVGLSSDATRIVTGAKCGTVRVRNLQNGDTIVGPPSSHLSHVASVGISPDATLIGWGCTDSKVFVWDVQSQRTIGPFIGHHSAVCFIAFSPESTRIISSSASLILMHDARNGKLRLTLQQQCPSLRQFGISPDGTKLATGSVDGSIHIWDAEKGSQVLNLPRRQSKPITSIVYSSDGTQIASASEDSTICVWDPQSGNLMVGPFGDQSRSPTSVSFSTDGTRIVSGFVDGAVFVWDAQTGNLILGPIEGHTKLVTMVKFLPDNTQVISHSQDGATRIHELGTQSSHPNDAEWRMNGDGWVTDDQSNLLCWVPFDLHANLMRHRTTGLISAIGDVRLQFDKAHIGKSWTECYVPSE